VGQVALDVIGWGTGFFDYDNDTRLDLHAVNGSTFEEEADKTKLVPMRSFLFWNQGESGYYEVGRQAGEPFVSPAVGRGSAVADYDLDGDLDLAVVVHGGPLRLATNEGGNRRGWVRLVLRSPSRGRHRDKDGAVHRSTIWATGARVRLTAAGVTQVREVGGQPSYLGQEPPGEAFFGTGEAERIERLEVRWPSGREQAFEDLPVRSTVRILEGEPPQVAGSTP
jgi:hypothetical protein